MTQKPIFRFPKRNPKILVGSEKMIFTGEIYPESYRKWGFFYESRRFIWTK